MMDQDISEKIHVLALDLEKFKSTANTNHDEISKLYDKIEKLSTSFTELKVHVDNLASHVKESDDNCKVKSHDVNQLTIDITKLSSSIDKINIDLREVKDGVQKHMSHCSNQMSNSCMEIEKFKQAENILNVTLDDLKSDVSDLELSVNELNKSTDARLTKLEEVRVGYKVLKWVGGIIGGGLGFALMMYEFYEKLIK